MNKRIIVIGILTIVGVLSFVRYVAAASEADCYDTESVPCWEAQGPLNSIICPGIGVYYMSAGSPNINECYSDEGHDSGYCTWTGFVKCTWTDSGTDCNGNAYSKPDSADADQYACN